MCSRLDFAGFRTVRHFYKHLICSRGNLTKRCEVCQHLTSRFWNGSRSKIFFQVPQWEQSLFSPAHPHPSQSYNPNSCGTGTVPGPFICGKHKGANLLEKTGSKRLPLASLLITFPGTSGSLAHRCSPRSWEQIRWHLLFWFWGHLCERSSLALKENQEIRETNNSPGRRHCPVRT